MPTTSFHAFDSIVAIATDSGQSGLSELAKHAAESKTPLLTLPDQSFDSAERMRVWLSDNGFFRPALLTTSKIVPSNFRGIFFQSAWRPEDFLNLNSSAARSRGIEGFKKRSKSVLVLYDHLSTHVQTIADHLDAFRRHSQNQIFYAAATRNAQPHVDLNKFDVVVVHFSVRLSLADYFSEQIAVALQRFNGLRILFMQDEFDTAEVARRWMDRIGFHRVYSIIPTGSLPVVYPQLRFRKTEFVNVLAGYIPENLKSISVPNTFERPIKIGYRGRDLPYWYGALGQEKKTIGVKMKEVCAERGIAADIEWSDDKRIYGTDWFEFITSCRSMIGCEGGSNIFDEYGEIRAKIETAISANPGLTFEEAQRTILGDAEGRIHTNQITPKFFEAIALKTVLVLFEGEYSGVLKPDVHYIPLKKDFSNIDDVLQKLENRELVEEISENAHRDIVLSGRYSYASFIGDFDGYIDTACWNPVPYAFFSQIAGLVELDQRQISTFKDFDAAVPSDSFFSYFGFPHGSQADWFPSPNRAPEVKIVYRGPASIREAFRALGNQFLIKLQLRAPRNV